MLGIKLPRRFRHIFYVKAEIPLSDQYRVETKVNIRLGSGRCVLTGERIDDELQV